VIAGPAIIELPETTVVLHSGERLQVDEYGNFDCTVSSS
jgi:N-methylhydantoinase A/oxoprolinase/acetone carboxylase beta subunit